MRQLIVAVLIAVAALPAAGQVVQPAGIERRTGGLQAAATLGTTDSDRVQSLVATSALTTEHAQGWDSWKSALQQPAMAPIASALVPGTGQMILGQDRSVLYLAVEVVMWLKRIKDEREQRGEAAQYELLAQDVSRAHFSSVFPVGTWDYYEAMEHWLQSGAYSLAETGPIVPENDTLTYNGNRWLIAARNHGVDPFAAPNPSSPTYQAALSEYAQHAITPSYTWSWTNAQLQLDIYRQTIAQRNAAASAASFDVTILLANHVLSTVDAFTGFRLRVRSAGAGRAELYDTIPIPW